MPLVADLTAGLLLRVFDFGHNGSLELSTKEGTEGHQGSDFAAAVDFITSGCQVEAVCEAIAVFYALGPFFPQVA